MAHLSRTVLIQCVNQWVIPIAKKIHISVVRSTIVGTDILKCDDTNILSAVERILKRLWLAIAFMCSTDMSVIGPKEIKNMNAI